MKLTHHSVEGGMQENDWYAKGPYVVHIVEVQGESALIQKFVNPNIWFSYTPNWCLFGEYR